MTKSIKKEGTKIMELALDTLGTLADRQSTVSDELSTALKNFGRTQLAISFTEDEGLNGRFLRGFAPVTRQEAQIFVDSENPEQGFKDVVSARRASLSETPQS